jgi:hypothetical protein
MLAASLSAKMRSGYMVNIKIKSEYMLAAS